MKQVATAMGYVNVEDLYEALKEGTISMDNFMDKIVELDQSGGKGIVSFQEQAKNSCDSIGTAITNTSNRFKKGFATILTSMNETAKNTSFGSIAGMINSFSTSMKNFLDKIGEAIKNNEAFKTTINQLGNALLWLDNTIKNLSPEQLDKIVTAIIELVKAGPILLTFGKSFSTLSSVFNGLSSGVKILGGIPNKISSLTEPIGGLGNKIRGTSNLFSTFFSGISSGFSTMFDDSILNKGISGITAAFSNLGGKITKFLSPIGNIFSSLGGKIGDFISPAIIGLQKLASKFVIIGGLIKFNIGETFNQAFPNFSAGLSKITSSFGTAFQGIIGKVGSFAKSFLPIFTKCFNIAAVVGLVVAGLGLLQGQFGEQIDNILNIVTQKGPEIIGNLVNGIVSKIPDLISKGSELLQNLLNAIIANLPVIIQGRYANYKFTCYRNITTITNINTVSNRTYNDNS